VISLVEDAQRVAAVVVLEVARKAVQAVIIIVQEDVTADAPIVVILGVIMAVPLKEI
jgi:hypothetical protein